MTFQTPLPVRSALYMPASRPRLLDKAATLDCDALIVDLEDAVAPDAKNDAREHAVRALTTLDYGHRLKVLRVNAADTPWFDDDLRAVIAARPDAVLLPKVDDAEAVRRLQDRLDGAGAPAGLRVWAMLETPAAVLSLAGIAALGREAGCRLDTLCVGGNDLALAARLPAEASPAAVRTALQPWLSLFLAAARAGGLSLLDGVWNDFADVDGFARDCALSVASGFDGRTLIHPAQIEPVHAAFAPDADSVERARRVVEVFGREENARLGVVALDGRMLERLHLDAARRTLALAARGGPEAGVSPRADQGAPP